MRIINAEYLSKNPVQATQAHAAVSDKYQFVNSEQILAIFAQAGWTPVSQTAIVPRKESRQGFQKHMVRLEHPDYQTMPGLEGVHTTRPQLLMINSHDRASSLRLMWGMFRMACLNGIVTGESVNEVKLTHNTKMAERLPAALQQLLNAFPTMMQQAEQLARTQLTDAAVQQLIKTVYDARLEGSEKIVSVDYRLPYVRRSADTGNDAFTIFNRVQEAAIRGGIGYTYERQVKDRYGDTYARLAYARSREIKAIDQSVKINRLAYNAALALV
jgi:hypothetical protein